MKAAAKPLPPGHLRAEAMLLLMTFLWGSTFPATRWAVADMSPWQLLGIRFGIGSALALLVFARRLRFRDNGRQWAGALWLGFLLWLGYWMQAEGMRTTTAQRSGFLTALSVPLVPVLQIFVLRQLPKRGAVVGVALALIGSALLLNPLQGTAAIGDLWTLGCAAAWAVYIIELHRLSAKVDLAHMMVGQCIFTAAACWAFGFQSGDLIWTFGAKHWAVLIYLGAVCSFFTTLIMCRHQPETTPTRAALIYAAEPAFASVLAWWFLSEMMTIWGIIGAGLILSGIVVSETMRE